MIKKHLIFIVFIFLIVSCQKEKKTIGQQIYGDFNGDHKIESATIKKVSTKQYDGVELIEYRVVFEDSTIKPLKRQCSAKKARLINEGDLNNDNADDISISYESDTDPPVSNMETISFNNNKWNDVIKYFSISVGLDSLSAKELQDVVTKKNNSIIYYTYGESFEFDKNYKPINCKKIKKELKSK